ncbi:hypothetical protein V8F33_007970 [Rhypophila sp. PSN 637]
MLRRQIRHCWAAFAPSHCQLATSLRTMPPSRILPRIIAQNFQPGRYSPGSIGFNHDPRVNRDYYHTCRPRFMPNPTGPRSTPWAARSWMAPCKVLVRSLDPQLLWSIYRPHRGYWYTTLQRSASLLQYRSAQPRLPGFYPVLYCSRLTLPIQRAVTGNDSGLAAFSQILRSFKPSTISTPVNDAVFAIGEPFTEFSAERGDGIHLPLTMS